MSEAISVEDVQSLQEQRSSPPCQERVEVYAKAVEGRFRTIEWDRLAALLAICFLAPPLRFDRYADGPDKAILVDMAGRWDIRLIAARGDDRLFTTERLVLH